MKIVPKYLSIEWSTELMLCMPISSYQKGNSIWPSRKLNFEFRAIIIKKKVRWKSAQNIFENHILLGKFLQCILIFLNLEKLHKEFSSNFKIYSCFLSRSLEFTCMLTTYFSHLFIALFFTKRCGSTVMVSQDVSNTEM